VIPRTMHCSTTGPHHSEKSHGSDSEAPTNTGQACQLFTEIEGRGEELEQVITAVEQRLEGPVNEVVIQEFTSRRPWCNNRSKQLEPSSRLLKQSYPDQSDSGRVTGECWGPVGP
jgi:hypothetical protein